MSQETKSFDKNPRSKVIKKSKYPVDAETEKKFEGLKRKYANAVAFLLVRNVARHQL